MDRKVELQSFASLVKLSAEEECQTTFRGNPLPPHARSCSLCSAVAANNVLFCSLQLPTTM